MHQHRFAATLLATVIGLMGGVAVAQPQVGAAKSMTTTKKMHHMEKQMRHMERQLKHMEHRMNHGAMMCDCWGADWKVDGIYGPQTEVGVREYQRMHHLKKVDGVAGPETLKEMGLSYHSTLKMGSKGEAVKEVQEALRACWMSMNKPMHHPKPKPTPTPMATPTPMPTPEETPTPAPTPMETPSPMETPTPAPTESPEEAPWRPTLELRGGDWMLPAPGAASSAYDYTFQSPTWNGEAALWMGDWGIDAGVTDFKSFQSQAAAAAVGPVYMYNADLRWRSAHGVWSWVLGYRGMNTQSLNYPEIGFRWNQPLGIDWLLLQVHGTAGYNFSNSYFADGLAGLELRLGWFGLDAGFRDLYLSTPTGGTPATAANNFMGPQASINLQF